MAATLILFGAAPASGQAPTERAIRLYKQAKFHYNLGRYDYAADLLKAAIGAAPQLPGPHRAMGLVYQAKGQCDLALPYFRRYLQLAPHGRWVARVRQEINRCAAKVGQPVAAPSGNASIIVRCPVSGAQILIDGVARGSTPAAALPVQPGRHVINIHLRGYRPWTGTVTVAEGGVVVTQVDLKRDPSVSLTSVDPPKDKRKRGSLRFTGLPRRVGVTIGGKSVWVGGEREVRLPPGQHEVVVTKSGTVPWVKTVTVVSGKTSVITPEFVLTKGSRTLRKAAWVTVAGAVILGATGAALGFVDNKLREKIDTYDTKTGSRADLNRLLDRSHSYGLASNILLGFAGAAAGVGAILFVVTPEAGGSAKRGVTVTGGVLF